MVRKTELQYWNDITLDHMSEESDYPSNTEVIVIHNLLWRPEGRFYVYVPRSSFLIGIVSHVALNRFLELLDDRYLKSARSKTDVFWSKTRRLRTNSTSAPLPNTPEWTLKTSK